MYTSVCNDVSEREFKMIVKNEMGGITVGLRIPVQQ